mgnify:CR=1 FL=1
MKKVLLLALMLNICTVLSVCAQNTSDLRQKAIAESKRFYNELKAYNKSQDFELAVNIDVDMPVKNVVEEYEKVSRSFKNLFKDYYNFLGDPWSAKIIIILALLWRWTGYNMVFYLSGLQNLLCGG